jgi:prepilin-type N-terminal cleavage/methylation domain-containing protein
VKVSKKHNNYGFTLIEIVVVMFVIALISSVVVANYTTLGLSREAKNVANQLETLLSYAENKAFLADKALGVVLTPHSFNFAEYNPVTDKWTLVVNNRFLTEYRLKPKLKFVLQKAGSQINLTSYSPDKIQPQLVISNDGIVADFKLLIMAKDKAYSEVMVKNNNIITADKS